MLNYYLTDMSATQISTKVYSPQKEKQLYFNPVLIYTSNKVKLKEGKRRNGYAIIIFFLPANLDGC